MPARMGTKDNMKLRKILIGTSLACVVAISAAALSSCGASKEDPWSYDAAFSSDILLATDTESPVFTGEEWTGKTFAKDVNGHYVSQSDIVRINTLDYHSVNTVVFDSVEKALNGAVSYDRTDSAYYQLLTGEGNVWQLAVYKNEEDAEEAGVMDEFYKPSYDTSSAPYEGEDKVYSYNEAYYGGFKDVTLPASWQTQGFDFPIYTNYIYPWSDGAYGNEKLFAPDVPTVTNPVGFYRYTFDVDESWITEGRRVYISFGGVESAYYVYVNGHQVGYSEDSFDAADFDITPYLNPDGKDNLLAVKVYRWCDGSYFENQDFLRLAGIFRDVYLYSTTGVRISDYTVVTDLDDDFVDATLKLDVEIDNTTINDIGSREIYIDVKLFDADGNQLFYDRPLRKAASAVESGAKTIVSLERKVDEPRLWSDEDPYLYTLVISLYDGDGGYYGSISQQLGFREITFDATEGTTENEYYQTVLLNGQPLILKGVNRHENDPEVGRYQSRELIETDIVQMKNLNINAVRTSHYPNCEMFYNMCDKYGILVMGECNIETHYNVDGNTTENYFSNVVKDRILAHTTAYKNRTCIIIWSMGNETIGGTQTFLDSIAELKQRDPTRPIHFESQGSGGGVDVASTMYSTIEAVAERGTWENHMPYLLCEYAHSMGNSTGNLYEYWEAIRSYDNILGAFIWDYVDQSILTDIPNGTYDYYGNGKYYAYGGCWGDNPNSGDFIQNGIISADRTPQPEASEVKYVYQSVWFTADSLSADNKTVDVYNEYRFTDLDSFDYRYELLCNGVVVDEGTFEVSCSPLEEVSVEVPFNLPENIEPESEFLLTVYACLREDTSWADAGYEIALEQFDVECDSEQISADISSMPSLNAEETDDQLIITGEDFEVIFNKSMGYIESYTVNGDQIIERGPVPTFTRGKNSNDLDNLPLDNATIRKASEFDYEITDGGKSVTISETLDLSAAGCYDYMTYIVYGSGEIYVSSRLELSDDVNELYRFGSVITLPVDYENMTYYGNGPYDTYCDRLRGSPAAVYSQTVTDSFVPYLNPQDTGNKTEVRYISLTSDQRDTGILVACDGLLEASGLHYTAKNFQDASRIYSLPDITNTYLNVDYGSRGTGGASCGPATLDQYRLYNDGRDFSYSYTIIPFDKNTEDIGELAKLWRTAE